MKTIDNDIRDGRIKKVYLLYGSETYLKLLYRNKLLKALGAADDETHMNYTCFSGKEADVKEIMSIADTMPFFADKRTVLITDSGFFKSSQDELAEYIKTSIPDTTTIIFDEREVDAKYKLYKAVKSSGSAVEFVTPDEPEIRKWLMGGINREKKKIEPSVLAYFIQKTGVDMSNMSGELNKLLAYTMNKDEITKDDIDAIVVTSLSDRVFEMTDAMAEGKKQKALQIYYELLELKVPAQKTLSLVARQFNLMLQVKDLKSKGFDDGQIAKKTGIRPYFVGKYVNQARGYSMEALTEAFEECIDATEKIRTGRIADNIVLEMIIIKYSHRDRDKAGGKR